jgi:uncharacterized protein (DUF1015 family)
MAIIKPFKAIRPTRDKAHLVATRPMASYKSNVLRAKMESNPFTFIHIIHPDLSEGTKTKANSVERFQLVRKKFDEFVEDGILIKDTESKLYLYRQTHDGHSFIGVIGGASVQEYDEGLIKKHEATLTSREEMFTNYLEITGFNAEPVLLFHEKCPELTTLYEKIIPLRPEYEFSTTDKVKHELWILDKNEIEEVQKQFEKFESTYIADGHHRSSSSASLCHKLKDEFPNKNYFLAFFIDESNMQILEFNRLVKKVDLSNEELLNKLAASFEIENLLIPQKPKKNHQITMNLRGNWYLLTCKPEVVDEDSPVASLDTEILTQFILSPILGIKDLKTDENIRFVSGNLGLDEINKSIQKKEAELGFVLHALDVEQIRRVADNNMIMPPKSTWVEPKLRSGLTIYTIKE